MAVQLPISGEPDPEIVLGSGERALVQLVAMGVPDREIAERLGVSETLVRDQLLILFKKLAAAGLLDQLLYVGEEA